jgi:hypothetical protein
MPDDTAALDDLLSSPTMDEEADPSEEEPDADTDDEFTMHAKDALGGDASDDQVEALRMAILAATRGMT